MSGRHDPIRIAPAPGASHTAAAHETAPAYSADFVLPPSPHFRLPAADVVLAYSSSLSPMRAFVAHSPADGVLMKKTRSPSGMVFQPSCMRSGA